MALRIGVDLGGTKIEAVALRAGMEQARVRVPTPRGDYDATVAGIASVVEHLEHVTGDSGPVGVGIPGTISPVSGLVKNANSTWLIGRPLTRDLEQRLGRRVRIANDANCFVMSEAADGAARGAPVVFGVIIGTGTGGGIVVGGQVLDGPNGVAGEWGHNPLPWPAADEQPGPQCYCGKNGCIETFLSGPALEGTYERMTGRRASAANIADGLDGRRTDVAADVAHTVLERYADRMARALAGVINVIDPNVIVLGGGLSNITALYTLVPARWGPYVFGAAGGAEPVRTRLVPAAHGAASGVRGAARLWP